MSHVYNKDIYKEYMHVVEGLGVHIPQHIEGTYRKYIEEQMKGMPYADIAVLRMYTLVFFLTYVKKIEGKTKMKDVYAKLEMQKTLIERAMAKHKGMSVQQTEEMTVQTACFCLHTITT